MSIFKFALAATLLIPTFTYAAKIQFDNAIHEPLSFIVNSNCSSVLKPIVPNDSVKFSKKQLDDACGSNTSACEFVLMASDNCTGNFVAQIILDTKKGIISVPKLGQYWYAYSSNRFSVS